MKKERSVGALVFKKSSGREIEYLLLHRPVDVRTPVPFWEFPKGHAERGETDEEASRREVFEETGIDDIQFVPSFREAFSYSFEDEGIIVAKENVFFLAETLSENVILSSEHDEFLWARREHALSLLSFSNLRDLLSRAHGVVS